nr:ribonuclease H-like domain-containing protein [Tanacetum cinerariifolium]
KQEEKRIKEEQAAKARYWKILACCDDDDDYNSAITPILSTEEPDNSLSESKGIPDTMCDVHFVNNPTPLEAKDHFEIVINSNDDISSCDDDSLYNENIEYVEASLHDSELVSLEAAEIVIPEVEEIEDDNLSEKLLNVHLLIANIEALKDNPTPSSKSLTKCVTDDMEEMDIKWNMALLSMRADKFWKRTGKKIIIQGSNVAGFDKSKVECFICHKMGHFARECRAPRNQERVRKESYRQGSKAEEKSSKALMAIDGVG